MKGLIKNFLLLIVLVLASPFPQKASADIAQKLAPAVVQVNVFRDISVYRIEAGRAELVGTTSKKISSGSGFFATPDGYLLTNKHVVDETRAVYFVNTGDKEIPAQVIYRDPDYDLAVLKVEGKGYVTAPLGSDEIDIGDQVTAIGNAFGRQLDSISFGTIAALNQKIIAFDEGAQTRERLTGLIESRAKLYPGDSGGPLVNQAGEVVGINVAIATNSDTSYAIPINIARSILEKIGLLT